jgi:hypothetical protein
MAGGLFVILLPAAAEARQGASPPTGPAGNPYAATPPPSRPAQRPAYPPGYGPGYMPNGYVDAPTLSTAPPPPSYSSGTPYTPPPMTSPGYGMPYLARPGLAGPGMGYGMALQGLASETQAQGQYWNQIEQARITREQSRQAHIDTQRKQVEWEMEYEKLRPTAPKMMAAERASDLDWARNHAVSTQIWDAWALNVLLKSAFDSPAPTGGPNIPLDQVTLRGLNLTDATARGSLAMTKDEGRIEWTESLQEAAFDEMRERFSKTYNQALKSVAYGKTPEVTTLRELRSTLKDMGDKLDDMVRDLPPSRYIESRRLLNQLGDTVKGLSNPRMVKAANQDWRKGVRTVAELVGHCLKNGLQFGPAVTPADYPAYTAAYYAIRSYERGVAGPAGSSTSN